MVLANIINNNINGINHNKKYRKCLDEINNIKYKIDRKKCNISITDTHNGNSVSIDSYLIISIRSIGKKGLVINELTTYNDVLEIINNEVMVTIDRINDICWERFDYSLS